MDKTIALFGATGGLGSQLKHLLTDDYNVLPLGSDEVDVTNLKEVKSFFKTPVDIVINLSGYNYNMFLHKYNQDNYDKLQRQINVTINGTLNILAGCLPQMRERNYGRIILTSSILSSKPAPATGVYSGCKAFIDNLAKTCTVENLSKGITCNTLQLGYMDGGLTYEVPEKFRDKVKNSIPLKRWGTIEEIANTVNYLINTEYVSGHSMKVNGGLDF